ncbi:hypothetical protein [Zeimonas arvi]|uniref:hypothetical protein n=1 Tax=Zeimonas arvi TaxID=2498847 RepID=UPI001CECBDB5|nr:hypothetical protein [Zeimonas arvi]
MQLGLVLFREQGRAVLLLPTGAVDRIEPHRLGSGRDRERIGIDLRRAIGGPATFACGRACTALVVGAATAPLALAARTAFTGSAFSLSWRAGRAGRARLAGFAGFARLAGRTLPRLDRDFAGPGGIALGARLRFVGLARAAAATRPPASVEHGSRRPRAAIAALGLARIVRTAAFGGARVDVCGRPGLEIVAGIVGIQDSLLGSSGPA